MALIRAIRSRSAACGCVLNGRVSRVLTERPIQGPIDRETVEKIYSSGPARVGVCSLYEIVTVRTDMRDLIRREKAGALDGSADPSIHPGRICRESSALPQTRESTCRVVLSPSLRRRNALPFPGPGVRTCVAYPTAASVS